MVPACPCTFGELVKLILLNVAPMELILLSYSFEINQYAAPTELFVLNGFSFKPYSSASLTKVYYQHIKIFIS